MIHAVKVIIYFHMHIFIALFYAYFKSEEQINHFLYTFLDCFKNMKFFKFLALEKNNSEKIWSYWISITKRSMRHYYCVLRVHCKGMFEEFFKIVFVSQISFRFALFWKWQIWNDRAYNCWLWWRFVSCIKSRWWQIETASQRSVKILRRTAKIWRRWSRFDKLWMGPASYIILDFENGQNGRAWSD